MNKISRKPAHTVTELARPVSTRKKRPTIMERAVEVEGNGEATARPAPQIEGVFDATRPSVRAG